MVFFKAHGGARCQCKIEMNILICFPSFMILIIFSSDLSKVY